MSACALSGASCRHVLSLLILNVPWGTYVNMTFDKICPTSSCKDKIPDLLMLHSQIIYPVSYKCCLWKAFRSMSLRWKLNIKQRQMPAYRGNSRVNPSNNNWFAPTIKLVSFTAHVSSADLIGSFTLFITCQYVHTWC